jgi:pyruvate dehydrogenase phosphatase
LFLCKQKLIIDRDDLTVEVIFFGDGEKSGDVVLNKEASASAGDAKAKL